MGEIPSRVSEERAQALLQAGLELNSALDLDSVLQRIIEIATKLTDARYGALGVLGQDQRIVEFVTTGMDPHVRAGIGDLPIGRGILAALIDEARTLRIPDISQDPRSFGFPPNHPPMKSFLGAPVMARGRVFGNIYLTEKRAADEFTEEDERTIEILAAQAGVAIENARLYDEARRQATQVRGVLDTVPEGVLLLDAQRRVAVANAASRPWGRWPWPPSRGIHSTRSCRC
jgi:GAF domain-containing protein